MELQEINRGAYGNDPAAEPLYDAFGKVINNFEIVQETVNTLSEVSLLTFNTKADAEAYYIANSPDDGVAFQILISTDPDNAGYWSFQSSAPGGVLFDRTYLNEAFETIDSVNLFDKAAVIEGFYIFTSTGALTPLAGTAVSDWIPVTGGQTYYLSGRTTGMAVDNVRFKDASGTLLKPLSPTGTPYSNYSPLKLNGIFPAPATAVAFQMQVKWASTGSYNAIQFELGDEPTSYVPFGSQDKLKDDYAPENMATIDMLNQQTLGNTFELLKTGSSFKVRLPFNQTKDIVQNFSTALESNGVLNFIDAWLLAKEDDISKETTRLHGATNDDACPLYVNNTYIGANHGLAALYIVTIAGHGKTVNDVASLWNDGTNDFYLLQVVSSSVLWFLSKNYNLTGQNWDFRALTGNTLTHVSGAVNTANINSTTKTVAQLKPAVKNMEHKYAADGKDITADGRYKCSSLIVTETYDIMDVSDLVDKLVANKPVGGYTSQPSLLQGVPFITIKNTFSFVPGGVIIYSDLIARKNCRFFYYGLIQNGYIKPSWATNYKRYIPHTTQVNDGVRNWDFRLGESVLTPYATSFNFIESKWESGIAPKRCVDTITDGSALNVNFNFGYLPVGATLNRQSVVNDSWFLFTTLKNYPNFVTGDKVNSGAPPLYLLANTILSGAAYRVYTEQVGNTNNFFVRHAEGGYLALDFHATGYYRIQVPADFSGKKLTLISKSAGVTMISDILQGTIDVNVTSLTNGYAYYEAKTI